tara:strand:+ start:499 stop:906 length:408 start_codon:yes stop_codon:yes gene_type:complete
LPETRKIVVDGNEFEVEIEKNGDYWEVTVEGKKFSVEANQSSNPSPRKRKVVPRSSSSGSGAVSSAIPGKIVSILVSIGDKVKVGDVLLVLEAMKMQNEIKSSIDGTVERIDCSPGEMIEANVQLVEIMGDDANG